MARLALTLSNGRTVYIPVDDGGADTLLESFISGGMSPYRDGE